MRNNETAWLRILAMHRTQLTAKKQDTRKLDHPRSACAFLTTTPLEKYRVNFFNFFPDFEIKSLSRGYY